MDTYYKEKYHLASILRAYESATFQYRGKLVDPPCCERHSAAINDAVLALNRIRDFREHPTREQVKRVIAFRDNLWTLNDACDKTWRALFGRHRYEALYYAARAENKRTKAARLIQDWWIDRFYSPGGDHARVIEADYDALQARASIK